MEVQKIIEQASALRVRIQAYAVNRDKMGAPETATQAQVCEFLRHFAGPKSAFFRSAEDAKGVGAYRVATLTSILDSFIESLKAGFATGLSPGRQARIDVVSDILGQAGALLEKEYHPAAAVVLIGASLEEFLRDLIDENSLSIGNMKPGIDSYCKTLRAADLISKQDAKDITSWAGIRNSAAHGEWNDVSDRGRIRLMLEGVNLFMRKTQIAAA